MTAQVVAKAKENNPDDVFVLDADTLHEIDRKLANHLGLPSTSALRDLANKSETARLS